jgi:hypothetical protein
MSFPEQRSGFLQCSQSGPGIPRNDSALHSRLLNCINLSHTQTFGRQYHSKLRIAGSVLDFSAGKLRVLPLISYRNLLGNEAVVKNSEELGRADRQAESARLLHSMARSDSAFY